MRIRTVTGLISSDELGITLPHEHVNIDYQCAWSAPPPEQDYLTDLVVAPENAAEVSNNAHLVKDNLVLNSEIEAIEEISLFVQEGGRSIISLTNEGLHPNPLQLKRISLELKINIIAGSGYYRYIAQDPTTLTMKADAIADSILVSINNGIDGTDILPGIIGEVGTSYPLHPFEEQSLIGSAKAQQQSGLALNIHPEIWAHGHLDVLDIIERAGGDLTRTVMSHMDELVEPDWHRKVAERGAYLSFDTFGSEFVCDGIAEPTDEQRIDCFIRLIESGFIKQLLISHDICYKVQLRRFGGKGYSHVLTSIIPRLMERGVSKQEIHQITVENPKRVLEIS